MKVEVVPAKVRAGPARPFHAGRATILALPEAVNSFSGTRSVSSSGAFAASIFIERHSTPAWAPRRARMRRIFTWFHVSTSAPARPEPRATLYEEARRLGIEGRSRMDSRELEKAIAAARRPRRGSVPTGLHVGAFAARARRAGIPAQGARRFFGEVVVGRLIALLRTPGPLRATILSAAALATGVLGLVVAYAVVPQEGAAAQDNGVRLVTITGPGGTRTVAVTRTKAGTTKLVPVRVLRTVTGPEGISTVAVTGPSLTDTEIVTQVRHSTLTHVLHDTETSVVTVTQPVTVTETEVVTQPETVVVTDTVVVTETETVVVPPGQP